LNGVTGFNVSHTIHHISFGAEYPGRLNPLDDKVRLNQIMTIYKHENIYLLLQIAAVVTQRHNVSPMYLLQMESVSDPKLTCHDAFECR
jgi:hypothetical protein